MYMQAGVDRSLQDESVSVREASLDLLGRHIRRDPALALAFFDLVRRATEDPGLSVRKR
jgi:cohesin loading factor subunit SCC2